MSDTQNELAADYIEQLEQRISTLEERLRRITTWQDAYPEDLFPKPDAVDYEEVRMKIGEMSTLICVDAMRHVATRMAEIAEGGSEG